MQYKQGPVPAWGKGQQNGGLAGRLLTMQQKSCMGVV